MLASLRLRSVRRALVIMLMVLSAAIVMERAQAVTNAVQHALAVDHAAPAMALAGAEHDDHHDHHPSGDDGSTGADDPDQAPGPHHHHSEGPQVAALFSPVIVEVAVSDAVALFMRADIGSPQSRVFGLERPPKTLSERA